MSDAIRKRIDWFEKTLKDLKQNKFMADIYNFGYCPKCDDITEIIFYSVGDDCAPDSRGRTRCKACGKTDMHFSKKVDKIRCTGNEIPPKFWRKWDRMISRTGQIKTHKEKIREFLEDLNRDCQNRIELHEEAQRRLKRFVGK